MTSRSDLSEHRSLVAALTRVNSEHLLAMGRRGGAEIELARALEDLAAGGEAGDNADKVAALRRRLAAAEDALTAIERERARLSDALAQLGRGQA
jgi:hypothetical protein